jgi:hypothetical protein
MTSSIQRSDPVTTATLNMELPSQKRQRKRPPSVMNGTRPINLSGVYWAEQELLLHTEFRDRSVPAGHDLLQVFTEALVVPAGEWKETRCKRMKAIRFSLIASPYGS